MVDCFSLSSRNVSSTLLLMLSLYTSIPQSPSFRLTGRCFSLLFEFLRICLITLIISSFLLIPSQGIHFDPLVIPPTLPVLPPFVSSLMINTITDDISMDSRFILPRLRVSSSPPSHYLPFFPSFFYGLDKLHRLVCV